METLANFLKNKLESIKKIEIIGDNFYYPCTNISSLTIKEDRSPAIISIENFVISIEKDDIPNTITKQSTNTYIYNYKNFDLKITTLK